MGCRRLHAEDLLDSEAAASRAGVSRSTWDSLVSRDRAPAPAFRLGGAPGWTEDQVDEWVAKRPGQGSRTDLAPKPKRRRRRR